MPVMHRRSDQGGVWSRFGMDGWCSPTGRWAETVGRAPGAAILTRMIDVDCDVRQAIEALCWLTGRRQAPGRGDPGVRGHGDS